MATTTTNFGFTKPEDGDFADNGPLNDNFDDIDDLLFKGSFVGQIVMSGSEVPPNANYMLADGSAISRTTYADLFAYYGTKHGVGDGSTTFNLPNLTEAFVYGYSSGVNAVGDSGGAATHTLTEAELPSHDHSINHDHASFSSGSVGDHDHVMTHDHSIDHTHASSGGHQHVLDFTTKGTTAANTNAMAAGSGSIDATDADANSSEGAHTHGAFTGTSGGSSFSLTTDDGGHNHSVDVPAFTGDSGTAGSGSAHNNMPPFVVLAYMVRVL